MFPFVTAESIPLLPCRVKCPEVPYCPNPPTLSFPSVSNYFFLDGGGGGIPRIECSMGSTCLPLLQTIYELAMYVCMHSCIMYWSRVMCYRLPDVSCSSEDADPWTVILQTFEGSLELCDFQFLPFNTNLLHTLLYQCSLVPDLSPY